MTHHNRGHTFQPQIDLDDHHAFAVCQGVGERLRDVMHGDNTDVSPTLSAMIERLPELDREDAPSLAPSLPGAH